MKSINSDIKTAKENLIRHTQLTLEEREVLAKHAINHGVNYTATLFDKHYTTVQRWRDRYLNNKDLNNIETTPLTSVNHKYLDSLAHLVSYKSLREIKIEYSLPYSIDTLAKYYRRQNITIENKHLLIFKCPKCNQRLRAINIYFGRPRNVQCPNCDYSKLDRKEYLRFPFYNPCSIDYFFSRAKLFSVNTKYFKETVLHILKIPKYLKCLFVYNIKPRKSNRIHIIKYFEKIGENTIPVTFCSIRFPNIQKREILNPRSNKIDTGLICQSCQIPYLRDFNKYSDKYPNSKVSSPSPLQIALNLFYLAQKYDNKSAYTLMGLSKKEYYKLKTQYIEHFDAIRHFIGSRIQ